MALELKGTSALKFHSCIGITLEAADKYILWTIWFWGDVHCMFFQNIFTHLLQVDGFAINHVLLNV